MEHEITKSNRKDIERTHSKPTYIPPVDIYEKDNNLVVVVDMPGAEEKSVDVNFENNILTIRSNAEQLISQDYRQIFTEYGVGNYERKFSINEQIDVEKITAKFNNGVLTINLPKTPEPEARKIPVKVE